MQNYYRPILKSLSLSGLSINISAALFTGALVGINIDFPKDIRETQALPIGLVLSIVFLTLTIILEKELEK